MPGSPLAAGRRADGVQASPRLGFAELIRPLDPHDFLSTVLGREPHHFPGASDRFASLFSFAEMNRLLGMWRLWSERTFKLVLDGRDLAAEEFCVSGRSRQGHPVMLVDARRVEALMARGATVVLDVMESLSPGVRAIAHALQSVLGGTALCNVYCSFEAHAGFPSHYDTTDVFALHIAGVKRWRVYEGRAVQPVDRPGHSYSYHSAAHHERARGRVLAEVEMTPGDVLYLPRGQYHDALAIDGASLHLSFGITRATGLDFMSLLGEALVDEALLREELPHFDDATATARHLQRLGAHLAQLLEAPDLAGQVANWQRARVFRDLPPAMSLPERAPRVRVRVRRGAGMRWNGAALCVRGATLDVEPAARDAVSWMLAREVFLASDLVSEFGLEESAAGALLDRLAAAGAIEPV